METTAVSNQVSKPAIAKRPKDIIGQLKDEALRSKAFSDVCHVFAMRERARQQVTMHSLTAMMKKNGFNHSRKALEGVLYALGTLGLGTLVYNRADRLIALKGIRITLQSIGMAAVSDKKNLSHFAPRTKMVNLIDNQTPQRIMETPAKPPAKDFDKCEVSFKVTVEGKTVTFDVPDIRKEDLGQFIASLYPRKPRGA